MIESCYQEAIRLLTVHKEKLKELAESLLEKEVIFKEDLVRIFGDRPGEEQTNNESEKKVDPTEKE